MEEDMNEAMKDKIRAFMHHMELMDTTYIRAEPQEGVKYRCPCCKCKTLDERGGYEICPVCWWEDDGQDDADAATNNPFSPNATSLAGAREIYQHIGASLERWLSFVRPPLPEEQ